MLNEDYREILQCLADERAEFLLVGAYALAAHGYPRATMDIDLGVMPSPKNAAAVLKALRRFGAPVQSLTSEDLQRDDTVFRIGVALRRVDLITGASGLDFKTAFARSIEIDIEGIPVRILCLDDLIDNKRASGRTQDLADVEVLESLRRAQRSPQDDA